MASLPKGRGRKGGIPKRKRLRTSAATPAVIVSRSATQHTSNSSLGGNPSSASAISDAGLVDPHTFCSPSNSQLNRSSSINVTNFSPYLQSTQVGNSIANLSVSQSLVITTRSSFTPSSSARSSSHRWCKYEPFSEYNCSSQYKPFLCFKAIEGNIRVCQGCRMFRWISACTYF